jgi:hypothetical protein
MSNDDPFLLPEERYWWYDHTDYPEEIAEFLTTLSDLGMIDGDTARGITKLAVDQGIASLSVKQAAVLDRYVIQPHAIPWCPVCGQDIRWSEMLHHDGVCAHCDYTLKGGTVGSILSALDSETVTKATCTSHHRA